MIRKLLKHSPTRRLETAHISQAWFFSKTWQDGEKKVDSEIGRGKLKRFTNLGDFLKDLKK